MPSICRIIEPSFGVSGVLKMLRSSLYHFQISSSDGNPSGKVMREAVLIYGSVLLDQLGSRFPSGVGGCAGPRLVLLDSRLLKHQINQSFPFLQGFCPDVCRRCPGYVNIPAVSETRLRAEFLLGRQPPTHTTRCHLFIAFSIWVDLRVRQQSEPECCALKP